MQPWPNKTVSRLVSTSLMLAGVAYPFLYYAAHESVPPLTFGVLACLLLAARLWLGGDWTRLLRWPLAGAILTVALMALLDADLSAKAYPTVMSWVFALLFAHSLTTPVSLIERFATLRGNDLSSAARRYCRKVSWLWTVWLFLNGAVAAVLAWRGDLAAWTLWTGLLSYLLSGVLFAGEFAFRRFLRPTHGAP